MDWIGSDQIRLDRGVDVSVCDSAEEWRFSIGITQPVVQFR
jgi:hypothetical protein